MGSFANHLGMSFKTELIAAINNRITTDPQMINLCEGTVRFEQGEAHPGEDFPYMLFALKRRKGDDELVRCSWLWIDIYHEGYSRELGMEIADRLEKLLHKKLIHVASGEARCWYENDFETPIVIDGPTVLPQLYRYTIVFEIRYTDNSLVEAILTD